MIEEQTLLENFFNSIDYWNYLILLFLINFSFFISVKVQRYRKINFLATSVLLSGIKVD